MSARPAWGLAVVGALAQLAMMRGLLPAPEGVRVALAFALLVLSPGAAWLELLGQRPPGGRWLSAGWALALGVAWNAVLLSLTALLRWPFMIVGPVSVLTTATLWCAVAARASRPHAPADRSGDLRGIAVVLVAAAALFAAVHCATLGARLTFMSDAPDHIGTLRRMLEHGTLFPTDAFYRNAGIAGVDPRKFLWHGVVALVCTLANVGPIETWRALPALLAPLFVLNVAALGALVGGGAGAAVAAWTLVLTYGGSLGDSALRDAGNAAKLADQLAIAACVAALADLARRTRGSRVIAAALASGAVATHVFASFQLALVLGALALGLLVLDRGVRPGLSRLIATGAAMLVAAAPFALWQVLRTPPPLNVLHTEPQGLLWLWDGVRVVSPGVVWEWMGPAWLLIPLLIAPLWRARSEGVPERFLLTTTLAAGVVMFAPPVVGLLEPRLGYLLMRVVWIVPLAGLAAWGLPRYASRTLGTRGRARLGAAALLALSALALLPALADALRAPAAWGRLRAEERPLTPLPWRADLARADSLLGPGRVMLSDPVTSYSVPMMSREYVVTMLDQHSPPSDSDAVRRIVDARDALDPYADWTRTRDVVQRYGVDAIVLNDRYLESPPADFWAPRPAWFAAARERFDAQPAAFERLLDRGDFVVYRVHVPALDALSGPPAQRPFVRAYRPEVQPIARRMGPGLPDFLSLSLVPAVAAPGDTLAGRITWRGSGEHRVGSYQVVVRFDRPLDASLDPPAFLSKPVRKLVERVTGTWYRFREDHLPVGGSYGVDLWERDQAIRDSFSVAVPRAAAPGLYQVRVRMNRQPHYPNLRLSDYFYDQDYFSGVEAGEMVVQSPRGAARGDRRGRPRERGLMCGISGVFHYRGGVADRSLIARQMQVLRHRGPDDAGLWSDGDVAFGHRRLAIVDLSPGGHQPMANEDESIWVTYNGELFDWPAQRPVLEARGHRMRGNADTESLLHLYEDRGTDLFEQLRGFFAFGLFDRRHRRLVLGRDRFGVKPLYYHDDGKRIAFASELKALMLDPSVPNEMDERAVADYLAFQYVPGPRTIWKGVRKLPPAHYLVADAQGVRVSRYWSLPVDEDAGHPVEHYRERLRELLADAVKVRLLSDVPLGAFLSGGIDSSVVVAMMARAMSEPVKTFSIGFEQEDFSELEHARIVARHLGTDHHELVVQPHALELLPRLVWQMDEPFADASMIPELLRIADGAPSRDRGAVGRRRRRAARRLFHLRLGARIRRARLPAPGRATAGLAAHPALSRRSPARAKTRASRHGRRGPAPRRDVHLPPLGMGSGDEPRDARPAARL